MGEPPPGAHVPEDYKTIQERTDAAVHSYEVVVANGDISSLQAVPFPLIMSMPPRSGHASAAGR